MNNKEIIGWKDIKKNNTIQKDYICPFCGNETLCIPIGSVKVGLFKIEYYTEYSCDRCGCIWRIKK